jgi:hypothetical protein
MAGFVAATTVSGAEWFGTKVLGSGMQDFISVFDA